MSKQQLSNSEDFDNLLNNEERFLVIKHSLTCPISQVAYEEYEKFAEDTSVKTYYLFVQDARPLSNHIAEVLDIKHESPQAILIENKQATWNASHWDITYDKLKKEIG